MTGTEDRGQAAVIGIVLLVGLVAVGGIGILLIGGQINDESEQRAETARIQQSFLELGRDVNTVSRTDDGERVIDLDLPDDGESAVREQNAGRIWVNRTNFSNGVTSNLVDERIGSIRYDSEDGTTFSYQAGAVFREAGNQTQVLSNPSFEYTLNQTGGNPTLTLPIVTTVGPDALPNGKVRATKDSTRSPINDDVIVENNLVSVTVKSEWYVGWADYFRSLAEKSGSTQTAVTVDHQNQTATLELVVPVTRGSVAAGVVGGASGSTFVFKNNINIDSYDSRQCAYGAGCGAKRDEAKVIAAGNLTLQNSGHIDGDVEVGGELTIENSVSNDSCPVGPDAVICGNASYGSISNSNPPDVIQGWANDNASVIEYDPVDGIIDAEVFKIEKNNDNGALADIDGRRFDCSKGASSDCDLTAGLYYLDEVDLQNEDINFDTSGGDITLAVNGTLSIRNTDIEVIGDGRVNVYVNSESASGPCDMGGGSGCDAEFAQNDMDVPNDNASRFWVYTDKDAKARFDGGSNEFIGVLFGPGGGGTAGTRVGVYQQGEIYGGLVGNVVDVNNMANIHFDRSLLETRTIVATTRVPKLTFLVVTSYVVEVDDS